MEDCYFFMNRECSKGSSCQFRHCEAAKSARSVCPAWASRAGCPNRECPLRHSVLEVKIRSEIDCYWENKGGCKRADCPFRHSLPREPSHGEGPPEAVATAVPPNASGTSPQAVPRQGSPAKRIVGAAGAAAAATATAAARAAAVPSEPSPFNGKKPPAAPLKELDFKVKSFEEIMREKRRRLEMETKPSTADKALPEPHRHPERGIVKHIVDASSSSDAREEGTESLAKDPAPIITTVSTANPNPRGSDDDTVSKRAVTAHDEEVDIDRQLAELDELINS